MNSALYLRLTGVGLPVLFGDCSIVCSIADSRFDGRNPPPIPRTHQYDFAGRLQCDKLQRELTRKERALAETAALLVLQKKYQSLWEGEEK